MIRGRVECTSNFVMFLRNTTKVTNFTKSIIFENDQTKKKLDFNEFKYIK